MNPIPASWLTKVPMQRIHWHWTAGAYTPNSHDLKAYHFVIDGDGRWHRGVDVAKNSGGIKPGYAAHTLNANSGAIGVSMACMGGAVESPFNPGKWPMKSVQLDSLIAGTAQLCEAYDIDVGRRTTLSHAEIQPTLGIKQRQKWDFTRLAFAPELKGAIAIGDMIRARVSETIRGFTLLPEDVLPAGATLRATRPISDPRITKDGSVSGSIPAGTTLTLVDDEGDWLFISTPAGYKRWVRRAQVELVDGPPALEPTKPDRMSRFLDELKQLIESYEKET